MLYEFTGIIENDLGERIIGAKGTKFHDIVVGEDKDTETKYPRHIKFTFSGKYADALDGAGVGDRVKITFGIDGRKWESPSKGTMFFVDLKGIKCTILAKAEKARDTASEPDPDETLADDGLSEDIPF